MTRITMNTILTNEFRESLAPAIQELFVACPEIMSRKFERANVQQGFTYLTTKEVSIYESKILCVGCFEDTAYETLKIQGFNVFGIDPFINTSLDAFYKEANAAGILFDTIFSTSVIEHVEDDEVFLAQICKLLKPKGYGILTCDYKDGWKLGDPKPGEDFRLYTDFDMRVRLGKILKLNNCSLVGTPNYEFPPDFDYGIHKYSFATLMFQKNE